MLAFHRFDPSACDFPPAAVPVLPVASGGDWLWQGGVRADRTTRWYSRGRYALHDAYRAAGVGPQGALVAPAYHCRTMIDPAVALGAEVALHSQRGDLTVDLDELRRTVDSCRHPPRALLLTHYFGIRRPDVDDVRRFCTDRDLVLIEDCAHAFVPDRASAQRQGIGLAGQYAVSSFYKFIPSDDGAMLWTNGGGTLPEPNRPPTLVDEMRSVVHVLQRARASARPRLTPSANGNGSEGADILEVPQANPSRHYLPSSESRSCLRLSRWQLRHASEDRLARRRRARHREWMEAVAGLPGCRALLPTLPPEAIPYMFPLLVDQPRAVFFPLKRLGMPIWRWDEMAVSGCPIAARYRMSLFHLPCHQSLTDEQMAWMTGHVRRVLQDTGGPP